MRGAQSWWLTRLAGWLPLAAVVSVMPGGWICRADVPPARHAYLGCSPVEADALYGPPRQRKTVAAAAPAVAREQRIYAAGQGRQVEIWFGDAGAEAILLADGNDLETIYQVLHDSGAEGSWRLDGRVWRHDDDEIVAGVLGQGTLAVGSAAWLVKLVEQEVGQGEGQE